jgi:secreted trypsin-like serine protease
MSFSVCVIRFSSSLSSITFLAGTIYLDNGGTRHQVEQIIIHQGYDEDDSWRNDIAVVKVAYIQPLRSREKPSLTFTHQTSGSEANICHGHIKF